MNNLKKIYKNFVINYEPFKWEVKEEDRRDQFNNKHSFEIGFVRFFKVFEFLNKIKKNLINPKIIDVGAYPGNMIKLSREIFNPYKEYISVGLDLDEKFIKEVKKYNVNCIDTEIDPNFARSKDVKEWSLKECDICYLLDTIEHLVDPIFCLENINKSLKKGGFLIITTDNITNFFYILRMIVKGKSPNVHPVLSSMFFHGNHRPHNKEFSKEELDFLLKYTGFKIENHEYFDRKQGEFYVKDKKIEKIKSNLSFKKIFSKFLKEFTYFIPHFRNHQIILAKKVENIEDMERIKPTTSEKEWMNLRLKTIGY